MTRLPLTDVHIDAHGRRWFLCAPQAFVHQQGPLAGELAAAGWRCGWITTEMPPSPDVPQPPLAVPP